MMSESLRYLPPKAGKKVQVIGAGLPRTGTNSFCAAVSYLLDGPAYHVGVQTVKNDSDADVRDWIRVSEAWLDNTPERRKEVISVLRARLDGYVVATDPPASLLVPELLEAFPDARVVCTVRDRESWAESMAMIVRLSKPKLFRFIFYWVPVLHLLPRLWNLFTPMWFRVYGTEVTTAESAMVVWEKHHAWLVSIVPKDRLFFVDVKQGWEPLCRALDIPNTPDIPFPRLNDSRDIEAVFKTLAMRGLMRWAALFAALAVMLGSGAMWIRF